MIKIGEKIPNAVLMRLTETGIEKVELADLLKGKKIVLFGVPGAFTPTCTIQHLHGFVEHADKIKSMGVDEIICVAVDDVFVMDAWGKDAKVNGKILLLSDWDAAFSKKMELTFDGSEIGLGVRSLRYNALLVDGVLQKMDVEGDLTQCDITHADKVLKYL